MLSAVPIPTYLTVSDFGIVTAAGNMMSMRNTREEMPKINRVFHSCLFIIVVVVPLWIFDFG